jgi:hypothetical protein
MFESLLLKFLSNGDAVSAVLIWENGRIPSCFSGANGSGGKRGVSAQTRHGDHRHERTAALWQAHGIRPANSRGSHNKTRDPIWKQCYDLLRFQDFGDGGAFPEISMAQFPLGEFSLLQIILKPRIHALTFQSRSIFVS